MAERKNSIANGSEQRYPRRSLSKGRYADDSALTAEKLSAKAISIANGSEQRRPLRRLSKRRYAEPVLTAETRRRGEWNGKTISIANGSEQRRPLRNLSKRRYAGAGFNR